MTFRDDHDAALARADALEVELKRAEAERDQLKAELDQRPAAPADRKKPGRKKAKPAPSDDTPARTLDDPPVKGKHMAIFMVLAVAGLAIFLVPAFLEGRRRAAERTAWYAARDARQHHLARWQQLISVEPCVRDVALDSVGPVSRRRPEVFDPRRDADNFGYDLGSLEENCGYPVREIVKDPQWPATVRDPLRAWMDAETELTAVVKPLDAYLSHRDWQEDDYRGGREMWTKLLAIVARRDAALAVVRAQVLPVLRAEIKQLQAAHLTKLGNKPDEIWWRIELGLAQWDIDELALDAGGVYAGHDFDVAAAAPRLQQPVAALLARVPQAPIEIRRQLRRIEWVTTPLAAGQVPGGETPLWHLTHAEADLIRELHDEAMTPALLPDPGPEPADTD